MSSPDILFLRFLAQDLLSVFLGSTDVRLLLAPLLEADVQIVTDPFTPTSGHVPVAFVTQEGRVAHQHAAHDPVSLHVHKRLAAGAEHLPFLAVDRQAVRPWLGLFLLRELEALRLSRKRLASIAEGASNDAFRPFRDDAFYRDEVNKHRFVAGLLEQHKDAPPFTALVGKARKADGRTIVNTAGDFCAAFSGAGTVRKRDADRYKHFVACALLAETMSTDAFLTMLRADAEGTTPILSL